MREPYEQLSCIKEAISKITMYVEKGRRNFDREETIRLSIIYYLQTISDAVNSLSEDFKHLHSEIPWEDLSNFQSFLTHYYAEIDEDALWHIAKCELPAMKVHIEATSGIPDRITEHNRSISSERTANSEITDAVKKLLQVKREKILETAQK
jgi:uncharacterized protein with HEPN domain